ncbi:hypothetical protein ACHAWO_003750 [Cyclotella atomus]|uniref:Uncharacterized protein n=1 Tax=Cyclotella atomus TaxID=382360 RepID=A0ABD3NHW2_9STRA
MTKGLLHLSLLLVSAYSFSPLVASVAKPKNNDAPQQHIEQIVREKLERIALGYDNSIDSTTKTIDMEIELSEKTERCLLQSTGVNERWMLLSEKTRIKRESVRDCLAANNMVVQRLLMGWETTDQTKNSPLFQRIDFIPTNKDEDCSLMGNGGVTDVQMKETEGYDTAQQVITHTARDWTSASSSCRDATNGWIINAIVRHCTGMDELRVLVPGSGLCRLAYDISTCEHLGNSGTDVIVEANDSSVTMAFAAKSVLELVHEQAVAKIFPFVSDPQRNEIYSAKRFEMQVFPDENALAAYRNFYSIKKACPDLTYTVGDFSSTYSHESKRGIYNVVATSFFIDTATNIYEYIFIMKHLLQNDKSSIWVNCGPVQWHPCAMLRPTVDELKDILQACGFQLITWEIADEAVAYRHPDDFAPSNARYTREEGYRPLRFVACLNDFDTADDLQERIEYVDYLNEIANGKVKE